MLIRLFPARGGDCFLVDFENGHCILIDGGYSNTYNNSLRKYLQFLRDKGKQLDFVIMTHYDADHINGLIAFLKDNGANQRIIKVGEVIVNGFCSQACDDSDLDQVAKMKTGVEITPAGPKQEYRFEELCMDNHYPINKFNGGNNVTAGDVAKGEGYEIRFVSPSPEQLDTCYAQLNQQLIDKGYRQNIINLQNLAISLQEESYHEEGIVISEASGGVDSDIIRWKEKEFPDTFSIVNQASLAFEIFHGGKVMLFCGDADMNAHRDDLSRDYYDVIKLSHHGTVRGNECFFGVNSIKGDIESVCQFVNSNQDFQKLMTDSQKEKVTEFCVDFVKQTDFERIVDYSTGCYYNVNYPILGAVIQAITMMDISIEKDKCLEMLYLPMDDLLKKTPAEYLNFFIKHLSHDEIVDRLKRYVEKDMVQGYFAEILFSYARELKTPDEAIKAFAVTILCDNEKRFYHRPVWEYLSAINQLDSIVSCIAEGQINPGTVVKHIEDVYSYSELFDYFSELFDKFEFHKEKIEEDESNKEILKNEYPFIFDSIRSEEVAYISKELDYYLQRIFKYLVHQQSESHIETYLNEMLDKHSKSHLDYDEYRTNLNVISSVSHLDSLIRIFEMFNDDSYNPETQLNTLHHDITQALDNIARQNLDSVLEKMSVLTNSENMGVKRAANNYLYKWEERKHCTERPVLNVYEAAEKVATETNFYPFY